MFSVLMLDGSEWLTPCSSHCIPSKTAHCAQRKIPACVEDQILQLQYIGSHCTAWPVLYIKEKLCRQRKHREQLVVYLKSCKLCGYITQRPLLFTVIKNKESLRTFFSTHTVFVVGALKDYYALYCLEGSRAVKAVCLDAPVGKLCQFFLYIRCDNYISRMLA